MSILLQDIKDDMISKVIIYNLDRLTSCMKDLIVLIELFEEHDVQLYSLREKIDTKTARGQFFVSIIILIVQWAKRQLPKQQLGI